MRKLMEKQMEIWVTAHLDRARATLSLEPPTGYRWSLYDKIRRPVAAAKRMRKTTCSPHSPIILVLNTMCPIYDMTGRGQKGFKKKLIE